MSVATMVDAEYVRLVKWSLEMWLEETADLSDDTLDEINVETEEIHQAISEGLQQEETVQLSADLLIQTKRLAERRGHWQAWGQLINDINIKKLSAQQKATLHNDLGYLYRLQHRLNESLQNHCQAEVIAIEADLSRELVRSKAYLCTIYRLLHKYELSRKKGDEGLEIANIFFIEADISSLLHNSLGLFYWSLNNIEQSINHLKKACELYAITNDRSMLSLANMDLGLAYDRLGDQKKALELMLAAERVMKPLNNYLLSAQLYRNMATLYFKQNEMDKAERVCLEAYERFKKANLIFQQSVTGNNLAQILIENNQLSLAKQFLEVSIFQLEQLNDRLELANALSTRGWIMFLQKKCHGARIEYEQALEIIDPVADSTWKQIIKREVEERISQLNNQLTNSS